MKGKDWELREFYLSAKTKRLGRIIASPLSGSNGVSLRIVFLEGSVVRWEKPSLGWDVSLGPNSANSCHGLSLTLSFLICTITRISTTAHTVTKLRLLPVVDVPLYLLREIGFNVSVVSKSWNSIQNDPLGFQHCPVSYCIAGFWSHIWCKEGAPFLVLLHTTAFPDSNSHHRQFVSDKTRFAVERNRWENKRSNGHS